MIGFSFSQNSYPQLMIVQGDSLICMKISQFDDTLNKLVNLYECKENYSNSLSYTSQMESLNANLEQEIYLTLKVNENLNLQIDKCEQQKDLKNEEVGILDKQIKDMKRWRNIERGIAGSIILLILILK